MTRIPSRTYYIHRFSKADIRLSHRISLSDRNVRLCQPLCITYDFESETDNCVTVRDRDTMEQVRIPITELKSYIEKILEF